MSDVSMKFGDSYGTEAARYPFQWSRGSQTSTLIVSFHPGWVYELLLVSEGIFLKS